MNKSNYNILSLIRLLAFVSIICAIVVQPIMASLTCLYNQDFELVHLDTETGSNETESQEDETKDKKVELQTLPLRGHHFVYLMLQKPYRIQVDFKDVTRDISSPPPDLT